MIDQTIPNNSIIGRCSQCGGNLTSDHVCPPWIKTNRNDYPTTALFDVLEERRRQDAKWGEQNIDPFTYLAVLMEEVGETAKAALETRFGGPDAGRIREEAVQVAAVALAIVECLDRGKWTWEEFPKGEF